MFKDLNILPLLLHIKYPNKNLNLLYSVVFKIVNHSQGIHIKIMTTIMKIEIHQNMSFDILLP